MKDLIASHTHNIYLKPGEVVVARDPMLISTVLGSCVAVTMFSPSRGIGAICQSPYPIETKWSTILCGDQGRTACLAPSPFGGCTFPLSCPLCRQKCCWC